jgi:transcriptional regulator GlxA family with amidase domain
MHIVSILASHGTIVFDLSTAVETFGRAQTATGQKAYRVMVCGEAPEVRTSAFNIRAPWALEHLAQANTVIIPGVDDPTLPVPAEVVTAILEASRNGARIASICTGAFILAATGLLDGRRATTHWAAAALLAQQYPRIDVDPDVLFVDNGTQITSAGASAGIDMCLYLIQKDHGQTVAANAARNAVVPLIREGGQAQFIKHESPKCAADFAALLDWIAKNLGKIITVEQLALKAATSQRTLNRRFMTNVGMAPLQWLLTARIRRAQELLETTNAPLEKIASHVGFDGSASLSERFRRTLGVSPGSYRRAFNGGAKSSK